MTSKTPKYARAPIRPGTGPSPFKSVVCGVDGSLSGREAIAQAIALSGPETALSFVCVRYEAGEGLVHKATIGAKRAEQALREAVALARESGVEATAETVPGKEVSGPLLERASGADELVVASHGESRTTGILLESTASVAVHRASVPVLVARRPPDGAEFPHRVLAATDGSDAAEQAVGLASDIARRHNSPLTVVVAQSGDLPDLEDVAARASEIAAQRGLEPKIRLEQGHPEECILEAAEGDESSLIVLGSRGVTGLRALGERERARRAPGALLGAGRTTRGMSSQGVVGRPVRRADRRDPMHSSVTLGRVAGVEIGLNWTWLIIVGLIVWSLAAGVFPDENPGLSDGAYAAMAFVAALLFFVSLLLHELGHAVLARREGMQIDGITLWVFGGVARFRGMFPSAGAEFRIAIAGPLVSLAIGVVLVGAGALIPLPAAVDGVVTWLGRINLTLLAFNMLPALPLDGGRVFRSLVWASTGDFTRATRIAGAVGRTFGAVLIWGGISLTLIAGAPGGLWFALIGWFVYAAAGAEMSLATMQHLLEGLRVSDAMATEPVAVSAGTSLQDFVERVFPGTRFSAYPVTAGRSRRRPASLSQCHRRAQEQVAHDARGRRDAPA